MLHQDILDCSGCCDKIPWTRWLISNSNLVLTVLKVEKYKIKASGDLVSDEHSLLGSWMAVFLQCLHMVEGVKGFSGASFILFMRALP